MLFDLATIPLLYGVVRRDDELRGLAAACLWSVNPTVIYNPVLGTDRLHHDFSACAQFLAAYRRQTVWAGVMMTLACLMKFQSLYFAPLFGLALLTTSPIKTILKAASASAGTALAVFFPFMLRSGWTLPWEIYFGGFAQYPGASLNAFNYYGVNGLNYHSSDTLLAGSLTAEMFSNIMIAAALLLWFSSILPRRKKAYAARVPVYADHIYIYYAHA
jgi:Gpi18-like mannosyltransferase